jgi:regulator of protease activity HflC (stomatin/prohibitin superfamily)
MNNIDRTSRADDRTSRADGYGDVTSLLIRIAKYGVILLFGLIAACSAYNTVDTGNLGVKRTFREASPAALEPGLHWTVPFVQDIVELDIRTQAWSEKATAYTKDVQQAAVQFTLNFGLDPSSAVNTFITVGPEWQSRLVSQVVTETIEGVFGQYNAVDIVARREEVSRKIEAGIRSKLTARGVLVPNFQVTNIDFEPAFEKSVEAKVIAEQDAIREKNKTVQIEELARQQVATSKGAAESVVLRAKAEAESIRIRAEALANNPKLIELVTAEKWNGVLPQQMYGSAPIPFINVPQGK